MADKAEEAKDINVECRNFADCGSYCNRNNKTGLCRSCGCKAHDERKKAKIRQEKEEAKPKEEEGKEKQKDRKAG